ncbi:tetratricopeptide repeat protein, partial [uncultured Streptomyces sp.]|uniref:tetratricopeptide repeat protein n=1 Tax=uncultured Streptomyces sp. TaxID=174707 RepID=UPI00260E92F4
MTARSGIAVGGDASHNAFGQGSQVVDNRQTHIHHTPREVSWPLEIGAVPSLASAFQPRAALREQVDAARAQGSSAVLTQVLSGGGGVGKSQLAAAYAGEALHGGTDLVLWAPAVEVQQVITLYAQAASLVAAPGATGENPETDARALLAWLATTSRRWLVVLDDITDPTGMGPWWPASRSGTGWVLATTRLHDAALTGNGRKRVRVDVYTPDEAAAYLRTRLTDDDAGHLLDDTLDDLAAALGHLPLALGHAAAYMLNQDLTSAQYLALFNDSSRRLEHVLPKTADAEGYGRQIATTLLLSLDAAQHTEPTGLARPALQLAAHLDPAGHPHTLWTTPTVLAHLTEHRTTPPDTDEKAPDVTVEEAEAVLRVLHRYALINSDRRQEPRAVRIHALTARATRETTPTGTLPSLAQAAADALLNIWPHPDQAHAELAAALRSNTDHLHQHTDGFRYPQGRRVFSRAGQSLLDAGLYAVSVAHWERLSAACLRLLGPENHETLRAQSHHALSCMEAGRFDEGITLGERTVSELLRVLGSEHSEVLTACANLAVAYARMGRTDKAIILGERVLADRERILGREHPATLDIRGILAGLYGQAGRIGDAALLQEQVIAGYERMSATDQPSALSARNNLGYIYRQAGRTAEAIVLEEGLLADRERILGNDHPDTLLTRNNLAT